MDVLVGKLLEFGTVPSLLVLSAVVTLLIRKVDENGKKDDARAQELRQAVANQLQTMEERFEERMAVASKRIDELASRVSGVERDYLPREEHYREFAGWRAEINRLSDLIINLFKKESQ